ncbi:MAG: hypothetical protein U9Q03_06395 [Patescibacteria group bacterium]|nr:hypothetical protein [Patescibacteria group bacterium]
MGHKMKRFGLETVFFTVALPLAAVFTVVALVPGLLMLLVDAFRRNPAKRLEVWKTIGSLWTVIGKHLKYLWKLDFLPWRRRMKDRRAEVKRDRSERRADALDERKRKKRERQEGQRHLQELKAHRRLMRSRDRASRTRRDLSNYDDVDVVLAFQLMLNMLPLVIWVPHLVFCLIGTIVSFTIWTYHDVAQPREEPLPEITIEYEPQIADRQEADFGPWYRRATVIRRVNDPDFRNIVLMSDTGRLQYSRRFRGAPDGFRNRTSDRVIGARVTDSGQIVFRDPHRNRFRINPGQVFMFENYGSFAFRFTEDGRLQNVPLDEFRTEEIEGAE